MRHLVYLVLLIALAAGSALAQIDTTKWYVVNGIYDQIDGSLGCEMASNVIENGDGYLRLRTMNQTVQCARTTGYATDTLAFTTGVIYAKTFSFTYGAIEINAQYTGVGTWPALWLIDATVQSSYWITFPNLIWASHPEIDLDEFKPGYSGNITTMYQNVKNTANNWTSLTTAMSPGPTLGFNDYRLEWSAGLLTWKINGVTTNTATVGIPTAPMFIVIGQTAIGSPTAGTLNPASLPEDMLIDYVRICSNPSAVCAPGDPTMIFDDEFNSPYTTPGGALTGGSVTGGMVQ